MAYDVGGRGDQSFNDSAAAGLDKAKTELGVETKEAAAVSGENEAAREERLQQLVDAGYTPSSPWLRLRQVGRQGRQGQPRRPLRDRRRRLAATPGPNVDQITFAENEGSFLVGAAAALKSKTGNIGFVGGVNAPLIKKFEAGYIAGAKAVNPAIKIESSTSPSRRTSAASTTRPRARPPLTACSRTAPTWSTTPLAAPVVASSRPPRPPGKLAIGVDSDQSLTAAADVQHVIMTSMIKKVDVAVYDFIKSARRRQGEDRQQDLRPEGRRRRLLDDRRSDRRHQDQARRLQAEDHRRQDQGPDDALIDLPDMRDGPGRRGSVRPGLVPCVSCRHRCLDPAGVREATARDARAGPGVCDHCLRTATQATAERCPAVELRGITKRFPGVVANKDIDFPVRRGTVHAIVGENGAGKSTLMKILYGVQRPDEGTIKVDGAAGQPALARPTRSRRGHRHGLPALHARRQPHRPRERRPRRREAARHRRRAPARDPARSPTPTASTSTPTRWSPTSAWAPASGSRSSRCSTAAPRS